MATNQNEFEDFLKGSLNMPYFKKLSIVEMQNVQNEKIWEIKLKKYTETIFAKLMSVQIAGDVAFGYFHVIENMFEVDEKKDKPIFKEAIYQDKHIEEVHLTQMSL